MLSSEFALHAQWEDKHWWFRARRAVIFQILNRFIPAGDSKLIAEIGCGTGGNLRFLQNHYRVIGVDISADAVAFASQRVACPILLGDFREALRDRWGELDGIILPDVLEHVEDDAMFLQDIFCRMKPGCILLITVPAHDYLWSDHDTSLGHLRRYSRDSLRRLWHDAPVDLLYESPFNTLLFPAIALYRMLFKTRSRDASSSDLSMPSPVVNAVLYGIFSVERFIMRRFTLPFGVSHMAVFKKR